MIINAQYRMNYNIYTNRRPEKWERGGNAVQPTPPNILGVLSLIVWSLILVISIKYLVFVMRADNDGEGGILALTALIRPAQGDARGRRRLLVMLGLFGAALFYGDGMITPAISVLSAVEGFKVATPLCRACSRKLAKISSPAILRSSPAGGISTSSPWTSSALPSTFDNSSIWRVLWHS
jgi:K+ transporter